ncbi:MAG: hypothetical protein JXA66_06220 [Oligoflexia bacterium]|nr:hypothetical protein [Oligoflexia bacterium]
MLNIDLVSPEGQLIEARQAQYLRIPSARGELTVLPGHRQGLFLLGKGVMEFGDSKKYVIYKGLLEIAPEDKINVVAERVKDIAAIDKKELDARLKSIEQRLLTETLSDQDYRAVIDEYTDSIAELSAI